ncbi:hypothetical protein RHGRI_002562 [Rhododendron griersonianum]|uniref:RING-type E3 ubiquitin transferase n=1 Tax=Rhododendron griersonianum TaxID=479676 RepID=A0AAV6LQN6_9ERIC|nr:hypothetical protein RHGRI_002562 [Rhododendron griersonianum]
MTKLLDTIFAYNGDAFLAGVVCLLLVILFVLLLHMYAKWFLAHARRRRRRSVSLSHVLGPTRFANINSLTFDITASPTKGLEASAIASIPLFVYDSVVDHNNGLECVVCLSLFEDQEVGRRLPDCGHGFHVECIDMWLSSHSNCPICRAGVRVGGEGKVVAIDSTPNGAATEDSASEVVVEVVNSFDNGSNGVEVLSDSSARLSSSSLSSQVAATARLSSSSLSSQVAATARLSSSSLSSQVAAMGVSLKKMVSRNI